MKIGDVADDITQVFGIPKFLQAPDFVQSRVLVDINAAIQQMQNAGEDYYARQDIDVALVANQEVYELSDTIREVLDPARLDDGTLLRKLTSRGQLYQFGQIFLGQANDTVTAGLPAYFYVQSKFRSSDADDVDIFLHLLPVPSTAAANAGRQVVLPVIETPSTFTLADLTAGTALLPVPQNYAESIFLPLARWNATTCFMFYERDKIPRYEQEYARAVRLLEHADPRRPKPPESRATGLDVDQPSAQAPISPVQKPPR
jgi:hypothetical protein